MQVVCSTVPPLERSRCSEKMEQLCPMDVSKIADLLAGTAEVTVM